MKGRLKKSLSRHNDRGRRMQTITSNTEWNKSLLLMSHVIIHVPKISHRLNDDVASIETIPPDSIEKDFCLCVYLINPHLHPPPTLAVSTPFLEQ